MKFLLFGTGEYYNRYKIWFEKKDISALIDNSEEKQGYRIDGIFVISPEDIFEYAFDAVIILSFYVRDMKRQLVKLGVPDGKIYHFFDLNRLLCSTLIKKELRCYGIERQKKKKKILLLSQDLTFGGPALALYHAAQTLIKRGYYAVFASMIDGPLRAALIRKRIPVIIDENLMVRTMEESEWVKEYELLICNTMNFHVFLSQRDIIVPVAWWLHDALFFYDGVRGEVMDRLVTDNMRIWSVSPIPERAVKSFRDDFHVESLLYGVEDIMKRSGRIQTDKVCFTVIGYIEYRKGQDILFEAVSI